MSNDHFYLMPIQNSLHEAQTFVRGESYEGFLEDRMVRNAVMRSFGDILVKVGAPIFGLWYEFRRRQAFTGKYEDFYVERPWIEEGDRLGFTGVWLSEHRFGDESYLPSPPMVSLMRLLACEAAAKGSVA